MSNCPAASPSTRSMSTRCRPCPRSSGFVMTVPSCSARTGSPAMMKFSGVEDTFATTSPSITRAWGV